MVTYYLMRLLVTLVAIPWHEAGHALASLLLGDPTARRQGRLSLNPLRHFDLLGTVCMVVLGVGWARPVQTDVRRFKNPKVGMALTALAGPVSNLLLAAAALALLRGAVLVLSGTDWAIWLVNFLLELSILSVGLGLFNLIPIPPLDGSKVLAAFLPDRQYITLMRYERYGILVLLVLSFVGIGSSLISRGILGVYSALLSLIFL